MVNTGKPSTGCHTCRKRKVKCDEQRPHCKRCAAIGNPCPGYRETNITFFRNQSSWAEKKVRKRLGSGSGPSALSPSSSSSDSDSTRLSVSPQPPLSLSPVLPEFDSFTLGERSPVPRSPSIDPAVFATTRFYSEYVVSKGLMPFLDFLPELYEQPNLDPCFQQALPAVALASTSRQLRDTGLMAEAQTRYGQALSSLAIAIKDPVRAKSDEIFTAVFLLGMYEIIASEKVTSGIWDTHYQGRLALMHIRGRDQLRSKVGMNMFIIMHNQLFINSFVGREQPSETWFDWFFPALNSEGGKSSVLDYGRTVYQVARFHATLAQAVDEAKRSNKADKPKIIALIVEGIKADELLRTALGRLPSDLSSLKSSMLKSWARKNVHEVLVDPHCSDESSFYSKWTTVLAWNQFRTVRMHLFQVLHEAADQLKETDELDLPHLREEWKKQSVQMVDDFCATVPAILGGLNDTGHVEESWGTGASLRGYLLLWPLRASILAIGISVQRQKWIASVLNSIGVTLGIGQACALAKLAPFDPETISPTGSDFLTPDIHLSEARG